MKKLNNVDKLVIEHYTHDGVSENPFTTIEYQKYSKIQEDYIEIKTETLEGNKKQISGQLNKIKKLYNCEIEESDMEY